MAANTNSPRDGSRIPAILVKDTIAGLAKPASGLALGSVEAVVMALVDGSGNQIVSFGGGTQYVDAGAAAAHPTGTGIIFNNAGTYNFVATNQPLPVTIISGNPTTIAVTQSTSPWVVSNSGTFAVQATIAASQTIAVTNTGTFVVQATLAAETTKVIGTVNQGTSPWVVGTSTATGGAVPANAFYIGGKGFTGNLTGFLAESSGDGQSSAGMMQSQSILFNGTNNDRARSIINATDSTGGGLTAAGILAQFDDVSPSTVTENQFGNVRMNTARQLYVQPVKIDTFGTTTTFTITLASLASSTVGVGRQSTLITSNTASSALIAVKFTAGTSPTANTLIYVYLIRGDGTLTDDNAGASDAGLTVINAPLLGTILVSAATSNATYYGMFDTKFLGSLGPTFGIAIVNSTGATANATGGNFSCEYTKIT